MSKKQGRPGAFCAAFTSTLPVLMGFLVLGTAYGVLMRSKGIAILWTMLMSVIVFAGSMQYLAVAVLTSAFHPLYVLFLTLLVNARHLFYGVSMLEKYREMGKIQPFLIFAMCDETFSILSTAQIGPEIDRKAFYFYVSLLDYLYWVGGTLFGCVAGCLIDFPTKGLDFALSALFIVLFTDRFAQIKSDRLPALIGVGASIVCLLIFGTQWFILAAMGLILIVFLALRERLEQGGIVRL